MRSAASTPFRSFLRNSQGVVIMNKIDGGLDLVKGFRTAGIHAGIKKAKLDLALIVSDTPAAAAGVFTTNIVQAAPVQYDRKVITSGSPVQAVVVNSGNANACTGKRGYQDTVAMAETAAEILGCTPGQVLVSSTGVIGVPLPMGKIVPGIKEAASLLSSSRESARNAAEAILTTDTFSKEIAVEIEVENLPVTIAGIAKGSGMIHPNMATLLSFIITDAKIAPELLQSLLGTSVSATYNMISVDGDTSTNDSVVVLANGASNTPEITEGSDSFEAFREAFERVHAHLAREIVRDGEGASKFIETVITGAPSDEDAKKMAKAVITSNLVKTAMFGEDANWGRILCAMGYSGGTFDPSGVELIIQSSAGSMLLLQEGTPVPFDEESALQILKEKEIQIIARLQDGEGTATAWGCDLSYEYVKINGEYRT